MKVLSMMKKIIALALAMNLSLTALAPAVAEAYTENYRGVTSEIIAEGITMDSYYLATSEGTIKAYVTKANLRNPYVKVDALVGDGLTMTNTKTVRNMANSAGAVAGINADFFQLSEKAPIGVLVQGGEVVASPAQRTDMYGFGITQDNIPFFDIFSFNGTVTAATGAKFSLSGVNKPSYLADKGASSDINHLNMYTPRWGAMSRGPISAAGQEVEMVVSNDQVLEIRVNQPKVAIPYDGYVLAGNGTAAQYLTNNFAVGDVVNVQYQVNPNGSSLSAAVGGQAMLVKDGKRHWFSQNITGRRARTAVGASADGGTLYLVAIEDSSGSAGMTQEELADFMISIGCATAVNLDGGGSTTMVARHLGDWSTSLINIPGMTSERAVPVGLGLFSTAPVGELFGLKIMGPAFILKGRPKAFSIKAWDEHFNPLAIAPDQINWTISPEIGVFSGNELTTNSSGDATIKASVNNISQTIPIKVLGSEDITKIEVTPSVVALNPGASAKIGVKLTTKQGTTFELAPEEYTAQLDPQVGTLVDGIITAGTEIAAGNLTVNFDSTQVSIKVSVGGIERPLYGFEMARNLAFRSNPINSVGGGFRLTGLNEETFRGAGAGRLDYDFTKTDKTRIAYGSFKDPLALSDTTIAIGAVIKGDLGNGHWLRARVVDANGQEKLIDLAQSVNWKGWQKVKGYLPAGIKTPMKLTDIYLVAKEDEPGDKGTLLIDELYVVDGPKQGETSEQPEELSSSVSVQPTQSTDLKLGSLNIAFPAWESVAAYDITAKQLWSTELPTSGNTPVFPLYKIDAASNGDGYDFLPGNMKITVPVPSGKSPNKLKLMVWDTGTLTWRQIPSFVDVSGKNMIGKTDKLGIVGLMENSRPLPTFTDTVNSWANQVISQMAAKGIVKGFPGNKYMPKNGVTRAEFITLMANTLGWTLNSKPVSFADNIPTWAQGSISEAVNRGVVKGYQDNTFAPNKVISRAEMSVILDKALGLPTSTVPSKYADAKDIPTWAVQSIRNTKATALMLGSDNCFRPGAVANRAEAAAAMAKVIAYYLK